MRQLIVIGAPISGSFLLEYGVFAAAAQLMGWIGTAALAAHQIALQIAAVMFMVPFGIAMAATVRVGHAVGRGDAAATRRAGFAAIAARRRLHGGDDAARRADAQYRSARCSSAAMRPTRRRSRSPRRCCVLGATFFIADGIQTIAAGACAGSTTRGCRWCLPRSASGPIGFTGCWLFGFTLGLGAYGIWIGLSVGIATYALLLIWRFQRSPRGTSSGDR